MTDRAFLGMKNHGESVVEKGKKGVVVLDEESAPLAERFNDWLQKNGSYAVYGIVAVVFLFIILYLWNARTSGYDERDYLQAQNDYRQFSALPPDQVDPAATPGFAQLEEIMARHPELAGKYNGEIAQTFLRLGDMKHALLYGQQALKGLAAENLPFYEDFSKTSLLIADGKYAEALKRAEFLGKKMKENATQFGHNVQARGFGDLLFLYNLIRQALLQQRLGNPQGELATWLEFQRLTGSVEAGRNAPATVDEVSVAEVASAFKIGKVTLNDYIEARKKVLRK